MILCLWTGLCLPGSCDKNAECSVKAGRFECKCKQGYEGDGKVCVPLDPCAQNNGGCPATSTICDYKGPGQVRKQSQINDQSELVFVGTNILPFCKQNTRSSVVH